MPSSDSALRLKPIQLAALVILMAEAREVTNTEFKELANFTLTGRERAELERYGYVESRKIGQTLAFQLTDKGWVFCKRLHNEATPEKSRVGRSVSVLLRGLSRSLERLHISHAEFFKQPAESEPAKPVTTVTEDAVQTRIRAAYAGMAKGVDGWVGLADLREHLADLDRSTVDDALRAMVRQEGVRIIPVANTKSLEPRDREAALRIGDTDNHALWIGRP